MKYGYRTPNIKKSISAKSAGKVSRSINKTANPVYGKKGMGYINNPEKALYNKIYNKTTKNPIGDSDETINIIVGIVIIITVFLLWGFVSWLFE